MIFDHFQIWRVSKLFVQLRINIQYVTKSLFTIGDGNINRPTQVKPVTLVT